MNTILFRRGILIRLIHKFKEESIQENIDSYTAGYLDALIFTMERLGMSERDIRKLDKECAKKRHELKVIKQHNRVKEMYDE